MPERKRYGMVRETAAAPPPENHGTHAARSDRAASAWGTVAAVFLVVALTVFLPFPAAAQQVSVRVELETRDVYMGESFLMQLVVDGADRAADPDLSSLENDFVVEFRGGSNNSSQSISFINGRWSRTVQKGFVFSYQLTPKRVGRLTIAPITVTVEGKAFITDAVAITARAPEETDYFKVRITLSRGICYVGEPVILTVTWYLRQDVQNFSFIAPLLESTDFVFENPEVEIDRNKKYFRIPLTGGEVIAVKDRGMLDGESYATLTFRKALIPKRAGDFDIPEVIVACESGGGFRSNRDMFNDFFSDDFFSFKRERVKKYVIPSNRLALHVKELPFEGRPDGFFGHVGEYRISTSAEPTEVNVGDPITLSITLEGPDYLGSVDLPPLGDQDDLAENFKIPDDRADGTVEEKRKVFTQTIRAKLPSVKEIPPIQLVYFDTTEGRYRVTSSKPIPITVHETKVVTALDAEGIEQAPSGTPVARWKEGIAYNYEGQDLLTPQSIGLGTILLDRSRIAVIVLPPVLYLILLFGTMAARRRAADPEARRARGALKRLRTDLDVVARDGDISQSDLCRRVMDALREYLGDKLRRPGSTLTAMDAERLLGERGVPGEVIRDVREAIGTCEAGTYAGGASDTLNREDLIARVMEASRKLDRSL
ncbi:MAG TPA: BatD family protein [Patescibacteria group bacterium]|nr:BatD family protein [Patescibacteria group bacterium]